MNLPTKTFVYLGPQGSYTEIALDKFLMSLNLTNPATMIKTSIIKVIEAVSQDKSLTGIVPIENSIEGIVRETVDNLLRASEDLFITCEKVIPISHCLISKTDNINKIKKIVSHPQALAQCQHYINTKLSSDIIVEHASSTAAAVKSLTETADEIGAIGTEKSASIYGLHIVDKEINDIAENKTRFVMIDNYIPEATGNDKTSIAFSTKNETGCLVKVLNIFKDYNISLCYIESRPSKKIFGAYIFFVDCN